MNKEIYLHYNKQTGFYEGMLLVQVDAEIFRRFLLNVIEEDQAADLTDPNTWTAAIAKVGKITQWLDRPHVSLTPIASTISPKPETTPAEVKQPISAAKTKGKLLEERLREKARYIAPYKWDAECLTPIGDPSLSQTVRADIGRLRYDERQVLKILHKEWEAGTYQLDPEAAHMQAEHERQENNRVTAKIETMAAATNGSRLR